MQTLYFRTDSFLHRLNPLSKFAVNMFLFGFLLLATDPWVPLVFILMVLVELLWLGRFSPQRLARVLWPMLAIALVFFLLYPLAIRQSLVADTPLVWQWGSLHIYEGGLQLGLNTALRVLALLVVSLPFTLTTDSADFIRALVQQWRLPYRIGYSTLAAFRFVPMMQSEVSVIRAAHRVRGVNGGHGWRGATERVRRYAVPLLANAIRQAERTALAMDGRAFGAFSDRTYFQRLRFSGADWLFIAGVLLISTLLVLALAQFGLLGDLAWLQIL